LLTSTRCRIADDDAVFAAADQTCAGESTRGLPAPQYGELKNFGFVPKPGSSITMYDWQRFVPTSVMTQFIPATVLAQYLDNDTMAMLAPDAEGKVKMQRTLVGWQRAVPASIIQQYVPAEVLAQYVPEGVVMATTGPTDSPLSKSAQHPAAGSSKEDPSKAAAAAAPPRSPHLVAADSSKDSSSSSSAASPAPAGSSDAMIAAAVQKPRSGLAGLFDDLAGSRSSEQQQQPLPTSAYIVPVQQVQPGQVMPVQQQQQQLVLVQQPGGSAYYMPVAAVPQPNAAVVQQQYVATSVQQQQPVYLAPAAGAYPAYGPAVARTGPATAVAGAAGLSRDMQEALDRHNMYR
jgi:hypothetical protein